MGRQRSDLIYRAEYEPDMAKMVKALRVLLDFDPGDRDKRLSKQEATGTAEARRAGLEQPKKVR